MAVLSEGQAKPGTPERRGSIEHKRRAFSALPPCLVHNIHTCSPCALKSRWVPLQKPQRTSGAAKGVRIEVKYEPMESLQKCMVGGHTMPKGRNREKPKLSVHVGVLRNLVEAQLAMW